MIINLKKQTICIQTVDLETCKRVAVGNQFVLKLISHIRGKNSTSVYLTIGDESSISGNSLKSVMYNIFCYY